MKRFFCLSAAALALAAPAHAATSVHDFPGLNLNIPDGNPSGAADVQGIVTPVVVIASVKVTIGIEGTFNGDLYAYLQHGSGIAVLLNRTGRTASNAFGYSDAGFNSVSLDDAAAFDVHVYQNHGGSPGGIALVGSWQADGRSADPDDVTDASTRSPTALADAFAGSDGNGDWTLFVADLSGSNPQTLIGWSLEITGAVPEPSGAALLSLGIATLVLRRRRRAP